MENQFEQNQQHKKGVQFEFGLFTPNIENVTFLMQAMLSEMQWLLNIVDARIDQLNNEADETSFTFSTYPVPLLPENNSAYTQLVKQFDLSPAERLLLICSIIPHLAPEKLTERLRDKNNHVKLAYLDFGGYIDRAFGYFVPTLQTVLFLLAGQDKTNSVFYKMAISKTGRLVREGIIQLNAMRLGTDESNELQHVPTLTSEYLVYLQSGVKPRPDYGRAFPATWVTTGLDWHHLVLREKTFHQVNELMRWVEFGKELTEISGMFNVSYPCLFYGPPGTGKSLTAKLIGKKYKKDVFRVDLSMIVSKYIGETEKNLAYLFDRAQGKDWILFFDEADSLFSKRTSVNSAQDKWANLEVSYLLQRMEEHKGLTILATNLKDNIDAAMTRRFQSIIFFGAPKKPEREKLWQNLLPETFIYDKTISIDKLSDLELSGSNIANIIKDACLTAISNGTKELTAAWLMHSIKKEFVKEKRTP